MNNPNIVIKLTRPKVINDSHHNTRLLKAAGDFLVEIANFLPFDADIQLVYKPEGVKLTIKKYHKFKYELLLGWDEIKHSGFGLEPIKEFLSAVKVKNYINKKGPV